MARPVSSADILTIEDIQGLFGLSRNGTRQLVERLDFPNPIKRVWRSYVWATVDVERFRAQELARGFIYDPHPGWVPSGLRSDLLDAHR